MKTFKELMDEMISRWSEGIKSKMVVRGGKKMRKKVTDKKGYKMVGGKEVKMKSDEIRARAKAGKVAARKRKSKGAQIAKKRAKSMAKR